MPLSRRHFLKSAGAVSLGFAGMHRLLTTDVYSRERASNIPYGYGPLRPDTGGVIDLPDNFSYRIISQRGDLMDDGFFVPGAPDGMAAFSGPRGLTLLVRNHEVNVGASPEMGPFGPEHQLRSRLEAGDCYDLGADGTPCLGGTTTLLYDTATQELVGQHLSLVGTVRNCAGGPTPWNTWITCEETTERAGDLCAVDHGYCFEVPASAEPGLARPVALKAMGRFNHEAVAVDPASGIVYETEDDNESLIYRFIPNQPGRLQEGGRLQALCVVGQDSLDTRNWDAEAVPEGMVLDVRWIDMEDVESPNDDLRHRGFAQGAARFARGEGMWYGNGAIFFACTTGGRIKKGQIWKYVPSPYEGTPKEAEAPGRLELFVEPNDGSLVDHADNLTVAPWGDLVLCEDGGGEQFLVGVTPAGEIYKFGRNAASTSELAGVCFSPDGSTLFVNIQKEGLTLAITGPWGERS